MDPSSAVTAATPPPAAPSPPALLRALRVSVLAVTTLLVVILGALLTIGLRLTDAEALWIALPVVLGAADAILLPAMGSTVRALPYGIGEPDARRISVAALRTVTFLRMALAEAPALFGLAAALVADSLLPYAIGCAFSVPLLLIFAYPRSAVITAVRDRLEAGGTRSHLGDDPTGVRIPAPSERSPL